MSEWNEDEHLFYINRQLITIFEPPFSSEILFIMDTEKKQLLVYLQALGLLLGEGGVPYGIRKPVKDFGENKSDVFGVLDTSIKWVYIVLDFKLLKYTPHDHLQSCLKVICYRSYCS